MPTRDDAEAGLLSMRPSVRAAAIEWLLRHPEEISTPVLLRAVQSESTPQLRSLLNEVLVRRQSATIRQSEPRSESEAGQSRHEPAWSGDIASVLRHELAPAVGWIRLAGDSEIVDYARSATERAVVKLQRRIDGLIALIKQSSDLELVELDLIEQVRESWPDASATPRIEPDVQEGLASLSVVTDESLFGILLSNAFQNALDAERECGTTGQVVIAWGYTSRRFWIRVTNPFNGTHLRQSEVSVEGSTSKSGHVGHGLAIMGTAARLLGMTFRLEGASGTASLVIEGPISR